MGGIDKGLVPLADKPMVQWVFDGLVPQVDHVIVNANRNHEQYGSLSHAGISTQVVADVREGFLGPLSGMSSALGAIDEVPERMVGSSADADIVTCHDGKRLQPVFSLIRRKLRNSLDEFLDSGERKIDLWFQNHRHAICDCAHTPDTFININTEQEREDVEARLR